MNWEPIETAPKKVDILLYAGDAKWNENIYVGKLWDSVNGTIFAELTNRDCQTGCGNTGNPTYWMPLPAPPKEIK